MGVKQGCVLSPTLFSIYVNDLASEIKNLGCGVSFDDISISILLYADDIALISSNEEDFQRMLNVLSEWSNKWRITINEKKTKVIHFRPTMKRRSDYAFKCGDKLIEYETLYKYLGFWFNETLDMKKSIKEISKAASRALGAVYMKFISSGGMTYNVYSKLIESVVEPVLFYCSGIWGHNKYSAIDAVVNRACRMFLGLSKNATNTASRGDMGWHSCEVKQKLNVVRLWCRLKTMSNNRLVKKMHTYSLNRARSWEFKSRKLFESLAIDNFLLTDNPCKSECVWKTKEKLKENDKGAWFNCLLSNGKEANSGNKLRTYRLYKSTFKTETYVKLNMRRDQRRILSQFRSCNLPLAIETGRYTKPKTPLQDRICKVCSMNSIEDETHFLIDCDFHNDLRYDLFESASILNENFHHLNSEEKLCFLMDSVVVQFNIANYLLASFRRRRHAKL